MSRTLVEFEELLHEYNFVRVHKSHLVNLNHIKAYIKTDSKLKLSSGECIPVSRRRKEKVLERLKMSRQN